MVDLPAGRQGASFMSYFVYIIRSSGTGKFYTGITNDLNRRLHEHNKRKSNTVVSKYLTDFEYVYTEKVTNRIVARKIEKYLKSGVGREFRNNIIGLIKRV